MTRYVYDSFALLAYFQEEPGAKQVEALLDNPTHEHWLTTINVGEIFYIAARRSDLLNAEEMMQDLYLLPIGLLSPDFGLVMQAAEIKARHTLSYADCFAAALAQRYDAFVVTGDQEFRQIEDIVSIEWLPSKLKHGR